MTSATVVGGGGTVVGGEVVGGIVVAATVVVVLVLTVVVCLLALELPDEHAAVRTTTAIRDPKSLIGLPILSTNDQWYIFLLQHYLT